MRLPSAKITSAAPFFPERSHQPSAIRPSARKDPALPKLIVTEFISVDGIAEVEKLPGVTWNDETQKFKEDELADSGAMLWGARPMRSLPARGQGNRRLRRPIQRAAEIYRLDELDAARIPPAIDASSQPPGGKF
ncbi:hypothetical protein [Mesorhizobium sp. M1365]|uniref:hypothetical protein n=1 Tax=Mesorhizobium sp. M1365 TaxID=2957090 RepID=UPI0033371D35